MPWTCINCKQANSDERRECGVCNFGRPFKLSWPCPNCETSNPDYLPQCEVCQSDRPENYLELAKEAELKRKLRTETTYTPPPKPHSQDPEWKVPCIISAMEVVKTTSSPPSRKLPVPGWMIGVAGINLLLFGILVLVFAPTWGWIGPVLAVSVGLGLALFGFLYKAHSPLPKVDIRLLPSGEEKEIRGHEGMPLTLSFSPDKQFLLSTEKKGRTLVWEIQSGTLVDKLIPEEGKAYRFATSGGKIIGFEPKRLRILNEHLQETASLTLPKGRHIDHFSLGIGDRKMGWVRRTGEVETADFEPGSGKFKTGHRLPPYYKEPVTAFAICERASIMAAGYNSGKYAVWSMVYGSRLLNFHRHKSAVSALCIDAKGRFLASGDEFGSILITDLYAGKVVESWPSAQRAAEQEVKSLVFGSDDKRLFVGNKQGEVFALNWRTGHRLREFTNEFDEVIALSLSPNGKFLAGIGTPNKVAVWKLQHWAGGALPPNSGSENEQQQS